MAEDVVIDMGFRCHCCGCVFEAEPASFIMDSEESPIEVEYDPRDDEDDTDYPVDDMEFAKRVQTLTKDELRGLDSDQLDAIGMSKELRDLILAEVASEEICDGAVVLCRGCREEIGL